MVRMLLALVAIADVVLCEQGEDRSAILALHESWMRTQVGWNTAGFDQLFPSGDNFLAFDLDGNAYKGRESLRAVWNGYPAQHIECHRMPVTTSGPELLALGDLAYLTYGGIFNYSINGTAEVVPFKGTEVYRKNDGEGQRVWRQWHQHTSGASPPAPGIVVGDDRSAILAASPLAPSIVVGDDRSAILALHDSWMRAQVGWDTSGFNQLFPSGDNFLQFNLNEITYKGRESLRALWKGFPAQHIECDRMPVTTSGPELLTLGDLAYLTFGGVFNISVNGTAEVLPFWGTEVYRRNDGEGQRVWRQWHQHNSGASPLAPSIVLA